jgi:hypothetical protein
VDCYSVAKDFAGPVATVIAAVAAVAVTAYFSSQQAKTARRQADIAAQLAETAKRQGERQAEIAQQQADLAREKLRHDLYNRRFEIFTSLFDFYSAMILWKEAPTPEQQAARQRFFRASEEAVFLFPKDSGIPDLLKTLNDEGMKVIGYKEHPARSDPAAMIEQLEKTNDIQLRVFAQGFTQLRAAIHPYLDFSKN